METRIRCLQHEDVWATTAHNALTMGRVEVSPPGVSWVPLQAEAPAPMSGHTCFLSPLPTPSQEEPAPAGVHFG